MSILIKGMEMPKNCASCPCYYETEGAWRNECEVLQREHNITDERTDERPDWCPLASVPTPHGNLVDADVLVELCKRMENDDWNMATTTDWSFAFETFRELLEDAPTIIEAEGE